MKLSIHSMPKVSVLRAGTRLNAASSLSDHGHFHGDLDQVVPANFMLEAKDFFIRNKVQIETHLIKGCDHHIPIEASSIALSYILKKFNFA